jgi:flagellar hook-associated protein 1
MSISNILDIGNTGLTAQRLALDVTCENITNVNTPGYSRQTAQLSNGITTVVNGLAVGTGVQVTNIQRAYDSFVQNQMVAAGSVSGNANTSNIAMQMVQPLFNDIGVNGTGGLSSALQGFFSSWQDLASNPQGVAERQAVIAKGQQLADAFHQVSGSLTNIQSSMNQSLGGVTTAINGYLKNIASLNSQIKVVQAQGAEANELRDQRDLALQNLSQQVGIHFAEQPDGTVTVTLPGAPAGQDVLVDQDNFATLSLTPNAGNPAMNDVMLAPVGGAALNATSFIGGAGNSQGSIGATLQIRDTKIPQYLSSLDEFASTLATQVNTAHAAGYTLTGATGVNFFNAATTAAGVAVSVSSTDDIAAASTDPTTGGAGNNINAQAVAGVQNQAFAMTGGTMTLGEFYTSLIGTVGIDVQSASQAVTQSTATMNQLSSLRESESGVSLDEELTNLTKYQMAYQGAAKLINVGSQMLDTLLGMVQ